MKARSVPIEVEVHIGSVLHADAIVGTRCKRLRWLAKLVAHLCGSKHVVIVSSFDGERRAWELFGLHKKAAVS
jgi:hypothetical protein